MIFRRNLMAYTSPDNMKAEGEENMVADIQALVDKIVDYAEHYDSEFLSSMERISQLVGRPRSFSSITSVGQAWLQDSVLALASALWYGCARQGIPERYWRLATRAINETVTQVALHNRGNQYQGVSRQLEHFCQHPVDRFKTDDQWRNHDIQVNKGPMVRDLTYFHLNHKNLISNIRNQLTDNVKQTHFAIRANICGMGDKTTSFLLRDVAWVYQLEGQGSLIHTNQAIYIQPIDIWVRRLAEYLWPDLVGKRDWKVIAHRIVTECKQAEVSAIRFNQGAWYFGARIVKMANQPYSELAALNG